MSWNSAQLSENGALNVHLKGQVVAGLSTTTPLAGDATWTGTWKDITDCAILYVTIYTDQASATDGLTIEFSTDGVNVDSTDSFTIPAATGKTFSLNPAAQYVRVKLTNGATPQTELRLQTICKTTYGKPSSHRIQEAISTEDDAELVKAVLSGADSGGTFRNVATTQDGNLSISDNSNGLAIAQGLVTGVSFIHKFGAAPDFDAADNEITVTDLAADGTAWENMVYDYSATADIDSISSSNSGDTGIDIEVQGLDANYDIVTQTVTTDASDGQTRVALDTNLIRVFRMKNVSSTDLAGTLVVYVNTALTNGIPTDKSKIRGAVFDGNNQTEMAIYTVPNGYTGYMRSLFASTAGANKTSNYIIRLSARPFGQVFQLKHRMSISDTGSSHVQHNYVEPEVFAAKTDIHITAQMTAGGGTAAAIAAGFDIVLVQD